MPDEERTVVKDTTGELTLSVSGVPATGSISMVPNLALPLSTGTAVSDVERATWQQEKEKLYLQLDDKVNKKNYFILDSQHLRKFY